MHSKLLYPKFVVYKNEKIMKTFDIYFNDAENSNNKGFELSFEDSKNYIELYNGTNESYFGDYKGGTVSIVDNETDEVVYEVEVK